MDATAPQATWGTVIANHRTRRGLTQRQVADALGVTVNAVSMWERDHWTPTTTNQRHLVKLLEIDAATLHALYTGDAA